MYEAMYKFDFQPMYEAAYKFDCQTQWENCNFLSGKKIH